MTKNFGGSEVPDHFGIEMPGQDFEDCEGLTVSIITSGSNNHPPMSGIDEYEPAAPRPRPQ